MWLSRGRQCSPESRVPFGWDDGELSSVSPLTVCFENDCGMWADGRDEMPEIQTKWAPSASAELRCWRARVGARRSGGRIISISINVDCPMPSSILETARWSGIEADGRGDLVPCSSVGRDTASAERLLSRRQCRSASRLFNSRTALGANYRAVRELKFNFAWINNFIVSPPCPRRRLRDKHVGRATMHFIPWTRWKVLRIRHRLCVQSISCAFFPFAAGKRGKLRHFSVRVHFNAN